MLHRPVKSTVLPVLRWFRQTRNIRPTIKIGKDKFQLTVDVKQFTKDEVRVKATPEYVVIEGKSERTLKNGFVIRQFVRKFKLPNGCQLSQMESKLDENGILTVTAPRNSCDPCVCCEKAIPIKFTAPESLDASFVQLDNPPKPDPCEVYLKVCQDKKTDNNPPSDAKQK